MLTSQEADPMDMNDWAAGKALRIVSKLKRQQPLLYTHLRDMNDEPINKNFLLGSIEDEHMDSSEEEGTNMKAKCTRCEYCPNRNMADAPDRIYAHAKRCHGAVEVETIRKEIWARFGKESRRYKCPAIQCPICKKKIRGNMSNLRVHQQSRNCKKVDTEAASSSPKYPHYKRR